MKCAIFAICRNRAGLAVRADGRGRFGHRVISRLIGLLVVGAVCLIAVSADPPWAAGQTEQETDERLEYNVKLAYLCNLGRYVDWPAETASKDDNPLVIGILGQDPFRGTLDKIAAERKVLGRKVEVRHFASMDEYQPCHILFVPRTVPLEQQQAAIRDLDGKPVIVVGEVPGFAESGGCVNFYRDGENVRLEINPNALQAQQLKASSKLLSLAKIVK